MPLFFAILALGGLLLVSRKGTANVLGGTSPPQLGATTPSQWPSTAPPRGSVFLSPPSGYRRALAGEVTPLMQADAMLSLALPLGTRIQREDYAIGIESHYGGAVEGWHKGASVFVPA